MTQTGVLDRSKQALNTLLGGGMGTKESHHPSTRKRLHDEHVRGRRFAFIGTRRAAVSIFLSASASPYGLPTICAAPRSAAHSREREMAA